MKALILAAGYATRLYPLTKDFPKPLLKVGGRPIINYIADKISAVGSVDEIIVVTNSKFLRDFRSWSKGFKCVKRISIVDDKTSSLKDRRGAVGDMKFAVDIKEIKDDLIVIGGDNLFEGSLNKFVSFAAKSSSPSIGVYDIKDKREAANYGVVRLSHNKGIVDFKEKPKKPSSTLVAMCLYYFPKDSLGLLKDYTRANKHKHDATGFYIEWLRKKVPVYGERKIPRGKELIDNRSG
ncbi:MAG: nucleotidyltransferase family protein [Candidatus Omnitrophica bacterium]|nr:nucleotidyltransferase family protein [Candidatus Omnitrophota bacterium]